MVLLINYLLRKKNELFEVEKEENKHQKELESLFDEI